MGSCVDEHCLGCYYYRGHGSQTTTGGITGFFACMYWDVEDKMRPCKPGKYCTVKDDRTFTIAEWLEQAKNNSFSNRKKVEAAKSAEKTHSGGRKSSVAKDTARDDRIEELYKSGHGLKEIAKDMGLPNSFMYRLSKERDFAGKYGRPYQRAKWDVEKAHELYIGGMTYPQVSAEIGVALNTLKTYGVMHNWKEEKKKFKNSKCNT